MSLTVGSPVLTLMSGCDMDLLGVGNWRQMMRNVIHRMINNQFCSTSLCNRLYADGHVSHWCGSKNPRTVELLIDNKCIALRLSPCASFSTTA